MATTGHISGGECAYKMEEAVAGMQKHYCRHKTYYFRKNEDTTLLERQRENCNYKDNYYKLDRSFLIKIPFRCGDDGKEGKRKFYTASIAETRIRNISSRTNASLVTTMNISACSRSQTSICIFICSSFGSSSSAFVACAYSSSSGAFSRC